jgi:hypothetical protein
MRGQSRLDAARRGGSRRFAPASARGEIWTMTGKAKKGFEQNVADLLQPGQQMADDGGIEQAESFANIEPDDGASFANINPVNE